MNQQMESQLDPVSELVLQWEERRNLGETVTAADLCRDRPELIDEVTRRIRALEAVYRVTNRATPDTDNEFDDTVGAATPPNVPGFTILGVLGRGGMGVVYKARHERLQRLCALKMLRYESVAGPMERLRFRIEAESVAALQHPNIVQLFEVGEAGVTPYIVLEYVDGPTLAEQIRGKPLPAMESAKLVEKLAQAVEYAHRRGIIHRDLKPSNILLSFSRERQANADTALADGSRLNDPTPKITDFGLAKRLRDTVASTDGGPHTATGAVFGTPAYMAPEQALGQTHIIGPAADVYSLGAVLYELSTGRPPFQATNVLELLEQVRLHDPLPPRRLRADIPRDLEIICLKCLEKDSDKRYPSAGALADDLQRFQNDEPIQARKAAWWEYAAKWARRRPGIAALLAIVLGLLVVMAFGGATLAIIAMRATRDAVKATEEEKIAKAAAETRDAEKSAVLKFVENQIFSAARPRGQKGGLGRTVSLREAIEAAVPYVDKSFADQPLTEARLRKTLGVSFSYLGDGPKALEQFEKARALYTEQLGPEHPDTLLSVNSVANIYSAFGRPAEARQLYEVTLALQKSKLGSDHPDTLQSMNNLANSLFVLGMHKEALKLREETLHLRQRRLGVDHPDTLMSLNNLSASYYALGRHRDALKLREETLEMRQRKLGREHPETLGSMNNLANSYHALNRHQDALKLREDTLVLHQRLVGPDHPETLQCMGNLSISFRALGRYQDALRLREEVLELRRSKLGSDHPATLGSMGDLSNSYADVGRHEDALKLREKTLALQKREIGDNHPDTLLSMNNLADSYVEFGRYAESLELLQYTLEKREAKLGLRHPDTLLSMRGVATNLVQLNRGEEAVPLIDECFRRAEGQAVGPNFFPVLLDSRLRHFSNVNDAKGCQTTAEMYESLNRTDKNSIYTVARMRAVTATTLRNVSGPDAAQRSEEQANLAMKWLKKAVDAGYSDADKLTSDESFDSLRARSDFRSMLAELAARKKNHDK